MDCSTLCKSDDLASIALEKFLTEIIYKTFDSLHFRCITVDNNFDQTFTEEEPGRSGYEMPDAVLIN